MCNICMAVNSFEHVSQVDYLLGGNTDINWSKGLNGVPSANRIDEQLIPLMSEAKGA